MLGRLQWWLQTRDSGLGMTIGNLLSDLRYWSWRLTGGKFDHEIEKGLSDALFELRSTNDGSFHCSDRTNK